MENKEETPEDKFIRSCNALPDLTKNPYFSGQEPMITLKEAFEFAQFCSNRHYKYLEIGEWITLYPFPFSQKTTQELYQLFQESKTK